MTNTDADDKTTELCNTSACVLCIIVEYSNNEIRPSYRYTTSIAIKKCLYNYYITL